MKHVPAPAHTSYPCSFPSDSLSLLWCRLLWLSSFIKVSFYTLSFFLCCCLHFLSLLGPDVWFQILHCTQSTTEIIKQITRLQYCGSNFKGKGKRWSLHAKAPLKTRVWFSAGGNEVAKTTLSISHTFRHTEQVNRSPAINHLLDIYCHSKVWINYLHSLC